MDEKTASKNQRPLNRYITWRQKVVPRRENKGKAITDALPGIQVDPAALDMYAETDPLRELIPPLGNKIAAAIVLELPKWIRRGQMLRYGWGTAKGILQAEFTQWFANRFQAAREKCDPVSLKDDIRQYAEEQGFGLCGFTYADRRFISDARDSLFPYDTAIVLGMEMDRELLREAPRPGKKLFDFEIYVKAGLQVHKIAKFIRSKGYRCLVRIPLEGWIKFPPHAINAGLGELGANGVVITEKFGPRQRWCMISVDVDIPPDEPRNLGVAEYCDACRRCIRACPGRAIPEEPFWWRGVWKRKINDTLCWPWFVKYDGCGICLKVCPFNRFGYKACMEAFQKNGSILNRKSLPAK